MSVDFLPIRLSPGADLRRALQEIAADRMTGSAFVIVGIGSLSLARIRYAGAELETTLAGPLEVLSLGGSLSPGGAHLHLAVADASGEVRGGHLGYGSIVRTTAEILLAPLAAWTLTRALDPQTGFLELVIHPVSR